jgi:hypothetical protein
MLYQEKQWQPVFGSEVTCEPALLGQQQNNGSVGEMWVSESLSGSSGQVFRNRQLTMPDWECTCIARRGTEFGRETAEGVAEFL